MSVQTKRSDNTPERYAHIKVVHSKVTYATVFARKVGNVWRVSVAFCHKADQFCRQTGRNVARRKFFKHGGGDFGLPEGMDFSYDLAKNLADHAAKGVSPA